MNAACAQPLTRKHRNLARTHPLRRDTMGGSVENRKPSPPDADLQKGTLEDTAPEGVHRPSSQQNNPQDSLAGQLSHRETNVEIKDNDSDFPEPGSSPEHS